MKVLVKALTVLLLLFMVSGGRVLPGADMEARVIPELMNPDSIALDDTQIYVTQGPEVYIFSRSNLEQIAVFGKAGEGPQEFRLVPGLPLILNVEGKELEVNSFGKLSYFSKSGKFLREKRTQAGFVFMALPLGENLACWGLALESQVRYRTIELRDRDLKKLRTVVKQKDEFQAPGQGMNIQAASFTFSVLEDKLWVAHMPDFVIDVYDVKGNLVDTIRRDHPRREMTQTDKDNILGFLKTDKGTKDFFELLKPIHFPDEYPAILAIFATQGKMYVMTWRRQDNRSEVLIMNPDGKVEKSLWLPVAYQNAVRPAPFAIRDNQLFQLAENNDEEWELHITPFK